MTGREDTWLPWKRFGRYSYQCHSYSSAFVPLFSCTPQHHIGIRERSEDSRKTIRRRKNLEKLSNAERRLPGYYESLSKMRNRKVHEVEVETELKGSLSRL